MKRFYLTFGQKSPFRDGYVLIVSPDKETARSEAFHIFGEKFASLYTEEDFDFKYFPEGQYGRVVEALYAI